MSPVHLKDFKRGKLSYEENNRRFCLERESGTHIRSYDIDVNGAGEMEHFCNHDRDESLEDDGVRHHEHARQKPRPYISGKNHVVAGVIIGSRARKGALAVYRNWPIICLSSRQPVHVKTPRALFNEIALYTGGKLW